MADETLLEFPCRFPIKAVGARDGEFEQRIRELIKPHVPELSTADMSRNTSRAGNYLAVTVTIRARSKAQIDAIYADLSASDWVLMAL